MPKPRIQFDQPRRRWRITGSVVLVAGVAAIVVGVMQRHHGAAAIEVSPAQRTASAVTSAPPVAVSASRPAPDATTAPHPSSAAAHPCADKFADVEDRGVRRRELESAARVVDRHVASLLARGDDMSVAAAQLISMITADESTPAAADVARQSLARLAGTTTDPKVYALAIHLCRGGTDGNCQVVTGEHWSRLDPSNAMAWLYAFSDARKRGDMAAADAALQRAAEATTSDVGVWHSQEALFAAMPPRPDAAMLDGTAQLALLMVGLQAAWSYGPFYEALRYCNGLAPGALQRACLGLAEVLANRSRDLMQRYVAVKLAGKLGWTSDRVAKRLAETAALSQLVQEDWRDVMQPGCASRELYIESTRNLARYGEAGVAERKLAASGLTLDELVERDRERREAAQREWKASQAAAAASR